MLRRTLRRRRRIDWVVAGGESGPGARPMHPDWARSLRDQCAAAGVPFLFKQWGASLLKAMAPTASERVGRLLARRHDRHRDAATRTVASAQSMFLGQQKITAGRLLDGQLHDGFPA
jgi:hypothetical protein